MGRFIEWLFSTNAYPTQAQKNRARLIYAVNILTIIVYSIYVFAVADSDTVLYIERISADPLRMFTFVAIYMLALGGLVSTRLGFGVLSGWTTILMLYIGGVLTSLRGDFFTAPDALIMAVFVLVAGFINQQGGLIVSLLMSFAALFVGQSLHDNVDLSDLIFSGLLLSGITVITVLFLRNTRLVREEGASEVSEERMKLAEITSQVAQRISRRMGLDDVLTNAVEQIRSRYSDIYHAQIFLIDELGQDARLVASTGEVGQILLGRNHKLGVGSQSVIGQVTLRGTAVIAQAGMAESIHRRNELLPDTAVEAAFPLRIGDKVIGALDLQSKNPGAFLSPGDSSIFQSLADHIAVAIDNARLFEAQERSALENRRLFLEAETSLREIQRLNQQLTKARWENYLNEKQTIKGVTLEDNEIKVQSEWTASLTEAVHQRRPISQESLDGGQTVAVPITLRGETIGAIEIGLDEAVLEGDTIQMMQAVAQRLATSLDNARLFEESQLATLQEQNVSSIVARYQTASTVDDLLRITVSELSQSLGAQRASIRLASARPRETHSNGAAR